MTGVSVASRLVRADAAPSTPARLEPQLERFFTPRRAEIARAELDGTRAALRIEDL